MRNLFLALLLVLPTAARAERLGYLTIGPMIHWNFSDNRFVRASWGLEAAYWSYDWDPAGRWRGEPIVEFGEAGYGLALGVDLDDRAIRFYSEPQVGWVVGGLTLGPVLEVRLDGEPMAWGVQASAWANALVGFDFRYRRLAGRHNQALGLYGKVITRISGPERIEPEEL